VGREGQRVEIRKIEPPEKPHPRDEPADDGGTRAARRGGRSPRASARRAILRAEGEKQSLILQAEGRQQAANRDAEARVALAGAEAEATQMVSDAATQHGWRGCATLLPIGMCARFQSLASAPNSRLVIVPMESAALAGGIVQAMQLLRGDDGTPPAGSVPPAGPGPASLPPSPRCLRSRRRRQCPWRPGSRQPDLGARADVMSDWIVWLAAGLVLLLLEMLAPGVVPDVAGACGARHRTGDAGGRVGSNFR